MALRERRWSAECAGGCDSNYAWPSTARLAPPLPVAAPVVESSHETVDEKHAEAPTPVTPPTSPAPAEPNEAEPAPPDEGGGAEAKEEAAPEKASEGDAGQEGGGSE